MARNRTIRVCCYFESASSLFAGLFCQVCRKASPFGPLSQRLHSWEARLTSGLPTNQELAAFSDNRILQLYFPSTEKASRTLPGIPALIEYPDIT
jgi:hypothetical protein